MKKKENTAEEPKFGYDIIDYQGKPTTVNWLCFSELVHEEVIFHRLQERALLYPETHREEMLHNESLKSLECSLLSAVAFRMPMDIPAYTRQEILKKQLFLGQTKNPAEKEEVELLLAVPDRHQRLVEKY